MTLIKAELGRKLTKDLQMLDANSAVVVAADSDVVRVKIGRRAGLSFVPALDIDSVAATANGSTVTKNTPSSGLNRLEINQADMSALKAGTYTLELSLVDSTDSNAIKHVDHLPFYVVSTLTGDVGVT